MPVVFTPQNTHPSKRGSPSSSTCQKRSESKITSTPSQIAPAMSGGNRTCPSAPLEHQPAVIEQLPFEADLVGAHARGERAAEVGARQPAGHQLQLQQRLSE